MRTPQSGVGFTLIEVLVAISIVMVGLLGLAGMQARAQVAELESYQRAQALVLLYDMMDKMQNNRTTTSCFVQVGKYYGDTTSGVAPSLTCSASSPAANAMAVAAMTNWHNQLQGAGETKGAGATKVGAMYGARGCVTYSAATEYLNAATSVAYTGTGEYTIMVSWQGMADTFAPSKTCGTTAQYGTDARRRTVWATMRIGTLAAQ